MNQLPAIPVVDVRAGGPLAHATERLAVMEELRACCTAYLPAATRPFLLLADVLARRWLERSASPYVEEIHAIARLSGAAGVYMVNTSYQWACTVAARVPGTSAPVLVRTLDWPFAGLGRHVAVARQAGPAGEFWNVTWPGAVGVLTAMAPGRFAATINQAPVYRRTPVEWLRFVDYALNAVRTFARVRYAPPDHVLRQAFETARDYAGAKDLLCRVPMARPVLITLAGVHAGEMCVIERDETTARVIEGSITVGNDWQSARPGWEPRSCGGPVATDSRDRAAALATRIAATARPFDWLAPPVLNGMTRVAVELGAGDGTLRVIGLESSSRAVPAIPATQMLDLAQERVAA
jgi:hypothetical protein